MSSVFWPAADKTYWTQAFASFEFCDAAIGAIGYTANTFSEAGILTWVTVPAADLASVS